MKVCLIDDEKSRYDTLAKIIKDLNDNGLPIVDRFNGNSLCALDSATLAAACSEKDLFLVDLSIPMTQFLNIANVLNEYILALPEADKNAVSRYYKDMFEILGKQTDFQIAALVLAVCRHFQISVIITSTVVGDGIAGHLATRYGFKKISYPLAYNMAEQIRILSNEIRAFFDVFTRISLHTHQWFVKDDGKDCILHDLTPHHAADLNNHRLMIQKVFPWMPSTWWDTVTSAAVLHDILKTFCGSGANWITNNNPKNFTIGAAYFLLLLSIYERLGNIPDSLLINSFEDIKNACNDFLNRQDQFVALETVRSMYDLFGAVCIEKNSIPVKLACTNIGFTSSGEKLEIFLSWDARDCFDKKLFDAFKRQTSFDAGITLKLLDSTSRLSQISLVGFGSPGHLYLEGNKLVIKA
jgi:hypothetical protein